MKYTEFEAKVKEISDTLNVKYRGDSVCVYKTGQIIVRVGKRRKYAVSTIGNEWDWITDPAGGKLYTLATELAATPIEEREEPKKYYYRIPYITFSDSYLNYDSDDHVVFYHDKTPSQTYQTQFTREEYATLAKEHGIPEGVHISEEVTQ